MRGLKVSVSVFALPLLMGLPVRASVMPLADPTAATVHRIVEADRISDTQMMRASLRRDVARHPNDFIVFPTEAGAREFFSEHRASVEIETDPRMIERGVVGYIQGKTVVVLPWMPTGSF